MDAQGVLCTLAASCDVCADWTAGDFLMRDKFLAQSRSKDSKSSSLPISNSGGKSTPKSKSKSSKKHKSKSPKRTQVRADVHHDAGSVNHDVITAIDDEVSENELVSKTVSLPQIPKTQLPADRSDQGLHVGARVFVPPSTPSAQDAVQNAPDADLRRQLECLQAQVAALRSVAQPRREQSYQTELQRLPTAGEDIHGEVESVISGFTGEHGDEEEDYDAMYDDGYGQRDASYATTPSGGSFGTVGPRARPFPPPKKRHSLASSRGGSVWDDHSVSSLQDEGAVSDYRPLTETVSHLRKHFGSRMPSVVMEEAELRVACDLTSGRRLVPRNKDNKMPLHPSTRQNAKTVNMLQGLAVSAVNSLTEFDGFMVDMKEQRRRMSHYYTPQSRDFTLEPSVLSMEASEEVTVKFARVSSPWLRRAESRLRSVIGAHSWAKWTGTAALEEVEALGEEVLDLHDSISKLPGDTKLEDIRAALLHSVEGFSDKCNDAKNDLASTCRAINDADFVVAGELLEVTSVRRDAHLRLLKNGPSRELLKELRSLPVMWETDLPADSASATDLFRGVYPKIATDVAAQALQRRNAMLLDQERSRKRPAGPSSNQQLAKRSARVDSSRRDERPSSSRDDASWKAPAHPAPRRGGSARKDVQSRGFFPRGASSSRGRGSRGRRGGR